MRNTAPESIVSTALSRGNRLIGALVYWNGLSDVKIPRPVFRQAADAAGIKDLLPQEPGADAALNAATKHCARSQPRGTDRMWCELAEKGQRAVYRVMVPGNLNDGRAADTEYALVSVDAYSDLADASKTLATEVHPNAPADDAGTRAMAFANRVAERFSEVADYVHSDEMSEVLVDVTTGIGGITVKGGVYLVTESAVSRAMDVKRMVESLTTATFTVWEIRESSTNVTQARGDACSAFRERLSKVVEKVATFANSVKPEDASPRTVNAHARKFRELDAEVELWADLLGDARDALTSAIADAKQKFLGAYLGEVDDSEMASESPEDDSGEEPPNAQYPSNSTPSHLLSA